MYSLYVLKLKYIEFFGSIKETYSSDGRVRAILKKDKRALAEQWEEPQQYIEVVGVVIDCRTDCVIGNCCITYYRYGTRLG